MHENLVSIKNKLTFFYLVIISIVIIGSLGLFSVMSIQKTQEGWRDDLDRSSQILADYLQKEDLLVSASSNEMAIEEIEGALTAEEYEMMLGLDGANTLKQNNVDSSMGEEIDIDKLVEIGDRIIGQENYVMYAFNSSGDFIIPRSDLYGDYEPHLWRKYQPKLVYEMLKQGKGWIYYPTKKRWDRRTKSHVIRYFSIPELSLFICLEGIQKSDLNLLKEYFDISIAIVLLLILLASFFVFRVITNWHLLNTERDLHLNEDELSRLKMKGKIQPPVEKNIDTADITIEKNFDINDVEIEELTNELTDEVKSKDEDDSEVIKNDVGEDVESLSIGLESEPIFQSKKEENFIRTQSNKINISDVKSPLLKKLLEDIRKS